MVANVRRHRVPIVQQASFEDVYGRVALPSILCFSLACGSPDAGESGSEASTGEGAESTEVASGEVSSDAEGGDGDATTTSGEAGDGDVGSSESETGDGDGDSGTGGDGDGELDDYLRMNHLQVKGTHNSYHIEPALPFDASHEYTHAPLDEQLEVQGVRAFELDFHQELLGEDLEVYHIAVIDSQTTCGTFKGCLNTIKSWSDEHQNHVPIFVWMEDKDATGGMPITDWSIVDAEIRDVFPEDRIFTADDLQGNYDSPRERIETEGWPTLGEVRGQIVFIFISGGSEADVYSFGRTTLSGRAAFIQPGSDEYDAPWAAFKKINDPTSPGIADALAADLMVASNVCAADNSDSDCQNKLDMGKANGVHFLKDDIPWPVSGWTYFADFSDGNPARCNPQTAPPECTSELLEDLP